MAFSFKYKAVNRPDGRLAKSPTIPITLSGKVMQYDVMALVDSGADISAMPKDMADLFGLNLNKNVEETRGIGGKVRSIRTTVPMIIESKDGRENYSLKIPVNVILDGKEFPMLLGRAGFFDKFVITFDESKRKITLKKIAPRKRW